MDVDIWDAAFDAVVLEKPHEFLVRAVDAGAINATAVPAG
jgi:hypothetical protein